MTQVTAQMSISLDGYYTGPVDNRDPKDMTGWMQGPEAPGFFRVTRWVIDAMGWRERQGYAGGERSVLLEMQGELDAARAAYRHAARLTTSIPERRHLLSRATHLMGPAIDRGR